MAPRGKQPRQPQRPLWDRHLARASCLCRYLYACLQGWNVCCTFATYVVACTPRSFEDSLVCCFIARAVSKVPVQRCYMYCTCTFCTTVYITKLLHSAWSVYLLLSSCPELASPLSPLNVDVSVIHLSPACWLRHPHPVKDLSSYSSSPHPAPHTHTAHRNPGSHCVATYMLCQW